MRLSPVLESARSSGSIQRMLRNCSTNYITRISKSSWWIPDSTASSSSSGKEVFYPTVGIPQCVRSRFSIVPEPYGNKNSANHMDRRAHRRVPAQLQGFLLGNSHEIEAVTLDLSIGGARFDCDLEVYPGKMIRVRLVIPGAEGPVSIDDARVQWVGEDMFGVSFRNV